MIPKVGDKIKWCLGLKADKEEHYNVVTKVEPCEYPYWFTTYWHIWLDNGGWIREQDVLEIIRN